MSRSGPMMAVVLEVCGLKRQLRLESKHWQAESLGVGGNVVEARKVVFCWGHEG